VKNNQLHFLFISSDSYVPFRQDVAVLFGKELVARKHKIDWLLQSSEDCTRSYKANWQGSSVWVGATNNGRTLLSRFQKHILAIRHQFKLFRLVKENKYDFLQVKDKFIAALLALIACRIYGVKFIFWLSFPFPEESLYMIKEGNARYPVLYFIRGHSLKFLLYKIILPLSDHIFVQSDQMKKDVIKEGINEQKLTPVPMGIDLDDFPVALDANIKAGVKRKTVVYIGTLNSTRKIDFLVRVIHKVKKEIPDAILLLVGDGNKRNDTDLIWNEAKKLDIEDSITITGFLPREEALEYVRDAGVCVSPFYPTPILNSTSPTKLIEYMAFSRPVVANSHPDQAYVIRESGGGYCVPYDEKLFADAVVKILKNPIMSKEMGIKGRLFVEKSRSYKLIADLVEKQYFNVLNST